MRWVFHLIPLLAYYSICSTSPPPSSCFPHTYAHTRIHTYTHIHPSFPSLSPLLPLTSPLDITTCTHLSLPSSLSPPPDSSAGDEFGSDSQSLLWIYNCVDIPVFFAIGRIRYSIITHSLTHSLTFHPSHRPTPAYVAGVFYFYAGVSLLCVLLTYLIVPEVKGLSLKDVAGVFKLMAAKKTCAPCLPNVQVPH